MSDAKLLNYMGDDAQKWAQEFCKITKQKNLKIDEDLMIGWFANAIEHSADVRRWRKEKKK